MTTGEQGGSGYFLYHSIGQYANKGVDLAAAMSRYAEIWGRPDDAQWPYLLGQQARFIDLWTNLIGAEPGTLTVAHNVTGALYSLIGALPANHLKGKKLLVAGDCFPSLHFLLNGLQARFGFDLITVPLRPGAYWVENEDVIAHWDDSVGLALLTHASSTSSHLCDLETLVAHARAKGSLVGVDVTQSIGLVPYNVSTPLVDFTVSSTLKWLCGTSGAGVIQVARPLLETCTPELRGWFSQANPFSWDFNRFEYAGDIRRFDNGTPAAIAALGSSPALEWHARQDAKKLQAQNRAMTSLLVEAADEFRIPLASPRNPEERGGSIMLTLPEEIDPPSLISALRKKAVYADVRGRILRLSPGNITTPDGVSRLADQLKAVCKV
ncbi:aminotransferase class V-fold PLP-dependent enzyme [Devosia sp. 2618]|uniref:aminotransferase class V-fold PLP-dependent enzyme n=1 Tax=Devosia sp. 2618 TaxID=3156454 RepID=UPI0033983CD2